MAEPLSLVPRQAAYQSVIEGILLEILEDCRAGNLRAISVGYVKAGSTPSDDEVSYAAGGEEILVMAAAGFAFRQSTESD